jgi:hypothetical protein
MPFDGYSKKYFQHYADYQINRPAVIFSLSHREHRGRRQCLTAAGDIPSSTGENR